MMNAEKEIRSFKNRCRGLKKKLGELSTLCDVEVCMVCTHPSSSQLHLWPEDPSKVEQKIRKYRMMKSCGNNKKKVLLHSELDINGSGRKKQVPVLDEHLSFLGKDGWKKEAPVLDEQHLSFPGNDHDGKTKEEIYLESLPYEKLKEFMSALNGKIEQVKQEIAVKKMQAELMELIYGDSTSPIMAENENDAAAACCSSTSSSYDHQKMMGPVAGMQGMTWMAGAQNHVIAVPPRKQEMMCMHMPHNHLTANPSMQEMAYRMPQPHLAAIPPMHNIMWVPQNQLTPAIPAMPEMMLTSQNHHNHHVIYGNYSGNYSNQYARDVHAFNF